MFKLVEIQQESWKSQVCRQKGSREETLGGRRRLGGVDFNCNFGVWECGKLSQATKK